jgi:TPR repeat protein
MTALAAMYMFGDGVKVNGKKAVELLAKAIDLGDAEALFVRGVCSEKAIGVEKDLEDAKSWYAKAAEKGVTASALMG